MGDINSMNLPDFTLVLPGDTSDSFVVTSLLFSSIVKAGHAVRGTISLLPRLGARTSNCWFLSIVLGLLAMTTLWWLPLVV